MSTKPLYCTAVVALLALASASSAFAGEASDGPLAGFAPTKSRGQVVAELQQARATGYVHAGDRFYRAPVLASQARAVVKADTREAIARGEVDWLSHEHASYTVSALASPRTSH